MNSPDSSSADIPGRPHDAMSKGSVGSAVRDEAATDTVSTRAEAGGTPAGSESEGVGLTPSIPRRLLPSLALVNTGLLFVQLGVMAILVPNLIVTIDPSGKVGSLALATTVAGLVSMLAQPLVGALSDRTRSRFGRRTPWIVVGAVLAGGSLLAMTGIRSVLAVTIVMTIFQLTAAAAGAPLSAVPADRIPASRLGAASGVIGLGINVGAVLGMVAAARLAAQLDVAFAVFGLLITVVLLLFVLLNREESTADLERVPFDWRAFLRGFWISPRKHPEFALVFVARFLFVLCFYLPFTFQLYILTDYVKMDIGSANSKIAILSLIALIPTALGLLGGCFSDRVGRRKPFIYAASFFMLISYVFPLIMPNLAGVATMLMISSLGFGLYMAADAAFMIQLLPDRSGAAGKDLGILNVATQGPQALSAAIGAVLISSLGGYPGLFVSGMIASLLAAVVIIPIKSVR
ncbi:MFS transporter [Streptomyces sp. NBC_00576]|uniref:MFS transporter n=1 Tax=Streptomyces sp. NBC_00576 TaxID=2903665 RepID=UPI002E813267|nr:MFS transporter [Streptomyces sp. NBC_00576]WUB69329.1 MFS transporter [Streptomyces sp. NBC_00576]